MNSSKGAKEYNYNVIFSSTSVRNYVISEPLNEANEQHILQVLFDKINFSSVRTYGAIGDPKVSR